MVRSVNTYNVVIDVKPTDKSFGNDTSEEQWSLHAALQPDVPLTYSATCVPDVLSKQGIGLESWKRTVEGASRLWKERTVALGKATQEFSRRMMMWAVVAVIIMIALTIYGNTVFKDSLYMVVCISVGWPVAITIIFICFTITANGPFLMYSEVISEFEQKWSSLARELHDEFFLNNRSVTVETMKANIVKRGSLLAWTVGLRFSFQMQPVDEEEVAWCIANSQPSDVQDEDYEKRKLRVTKASQVDEVVTNDGNVFHGEHSTVAMAFAVVDDADGDVELSSDVGTIDEKRSLLDLV